MLRLYSAWHLNLCYSSIEEEQRPDVVARCYRPLLDLARIRRIPLGIEVPAWTLQRIADIDPAWLADLRALIDEGLVEFIGSGWSQIIGPIVPARVVRENLRLGNEAYERMLGFRPSLAAINEQAWSAGILDAYAEAGYRAVIMEWENPASAHPQWDRRLRYHPQRATGTMAELPLIWNHSIAFQKVQRLAHGEIPYDEWAQWVMQHDVPDEERALCIYGSDAETFGFRPGRYRTEEAIRAEEWLAIGEALERIAENGTRHILPSQVLDDVGPRSGQLLRLETPAQPIPTKKQPKYNIIRWACGGRDAPGSNTICERIFRGMTAPGARPGDRDWSDLCELWASDVRTHLTAARWEKWRRRAAGTLDRWGVRPSNEGPPIGHGAAAFRTERNGRFLEIAGSGIGLRLNLRRGLTVDELRFGGEGEPWVLGTLHHGRLDDIGWSADFYTWETVLELPGKPKVADLEPVEPSITEGDGALIATAVVRTTLGPMRKRITVRGGANASVGLDLTLLWPEIPPGSLRLGDLIVNPAAFDRDFLSVTTHLGGSRPETFAFRGQQVDHGRAWSALVSAQQCLGATEGWLEFGDNARRLRVEIDRTASAVPAMVTCLDVADSFVFRIQFSGREIDDTAGSHAIPLTAEGRTYRFRVSPVLWAQE